MAVSSHIPHPTSHIPSLPNPQTIALRRLANGMTVAAYENFVSPAVVMTGLLQVGAMDEADTQAGLASLTAALLSRGTRNADYDTLNEAIEGVGAGVGFGGRTHTTGLSAKSLAEDFPSILALVADMARHPVFPADHLERVRAQRLTGLRERLQNTRAVAELAFFERAFPPGHPYHRDPSGTPDTVAALQRDDLAEFHAARYGPSGAIVVVVGAIAAAEALDRVEAAFGDWPARPAAGGDRAAPPVAWPEQAIEERRVVAGKTQTDLLYGLPTIPRTHPDFLGLQLANTVLGTFGMMGRVGKSVRDAQGLAYYARTSLDGGNGPGPWVASAGVAPDKVAQAVASIRHEWERMAREPVPDDELADSKALLTGSLPLRLETNEGVARAILDMLHFDLGLDYLGRYPARVHALSAADVRRVSQTYFDPTRAILATAGP